MKLQRMSSLLDVATAPPGMALEDGVWFTHDLDMQVVADHVAPLLTGQMVRDVAERRRRAAAFEFTHKEGGPPRLLVVADGRRMTSGPAVRWVRVVPVHGRVQHAKFGLLVFRAADRGERRVRAFVSSANLTRGGSASNLEFLVAEDRPKGGSAPTLAGDLVVALHAFVLAAERSEGDVRGADASALRSAWKWLSTMSGRPAGLVRHSLDEQRPLLPPSDQGPAGRVDIVSPAFAAPTDSAVVDKVLASHLSPATTVVWHVGADPDGRVRVPKAAWSALRGASSTTLALVGSDGDQRRPLHAKVLAITAAGTVTATAGSANFTSRGLGGRNRELVVVWTCPARSWTLIDELGSTPHHGRPLFTTRTVERGGDVSVVLPGVTAVSVGADEHGSLWGRLDVDTTGLPRGATVEVKVAGRWRSVAQLAGKDVPLGAALVSVRITSRSGDVVTVDVPVDLSATPPDVWLVRGDREVVTNPELDDLLDMIRRSTAPRQEPNVTGGTPRTNGNGPGADDKYLQRLDQPLVLLARHHASLRGAETAEALDRTLHRFASALDEHRWNPRVEDRIARVLLDLPGPGGSRRPKGSKLLQALQKVVG